jgi:hypothetical protein
MATWPSYAKIRFNGGYEEQPDSAVATTEMEIGPPKTVRIKYKVLVTRPCLVHLSSYNDYLSFRTWFTSIGKGTEWFDWTDIIDGTVRQAQVVGGSIKYKPLTPMKDKWEVTLSLRTWE